MTRPTNSGLSLFAWFLGLGLTLSCSVHGASISTEKTDYRHGEKGRAYISVGENEPGRFKLEQLTGEQHTYSKTLYPDDTGVAGFEALHRTRGGYSDWRLFQEIPGGTETFIRIRQRDIPALPGAIALQGGPQFNYGDKISFTVTVPGDRLYMEPGDQGSPRYYYQFDRLPFGVLGDNYGEGTRQDHSRPLQQASELIDWTQNDYGQVKFSPGRYRIRLSEHNQIVDHQDILVVVEPAPQALSIPDGLSFSVGDTLSLEVDRGRINNTLTWHLEVLRIVDDGRLVPLEIVRRLEDNSAYQYFPPFERAGNYVLRLLAEGRYIVDQLEFKVSGREQAADDWATLLSTGPKPHFREGEKITVTYRIPREPAEGQQIELYRRAEGDIANQRAAQREDIAEAGDQLIASWKPEVGSLEAFVIDRELSRGFYELRFFRDPQGSPYDMTITPFKVIAAADSGRIDLGGTEFLMGENIPVSITLPQGMQPTASDLFLQVIRKGGYVAGCAIEKDQVVKEYVGLQGELEHSLSLGAVPGDYLVKLHDGVDWNDKSPTIAQAEFRISVHRLDGAIQLERGRSFQPTETVDVPVSVPQGYPLEALEDIQLFVNYLGYNAPGGSVLPANWGMTYQIQWSGTQGQAQVRMPESSGFYEFWLARNSGGCGFQSPCVVMDTLPFEVRDVRSPFANEPGVWGGRPERNLGGHSPLPPLGDYLDAQTCGGPFPLEPAVEKMSLGFYRLEDGKHVAMTGAIDFGEGFYIQGELEDAASQDSYIITLTTPQGDQQEVALFPVADQPTLVRSKLVYLIWPSEERESP